MTNETLIKELKSIDKEDLLIIFYLLLKTSYLSFSELSKIYVAFLEEEADDKRDLICELAMSLVQYKDKKTGGTKKQLALKAERAILRTNLFKGTKYEERLLKLVNDK